MRTSVFAIPLVGCLLGLATPASAAEEPRLALDQQRHWYGGTTLALDLSGASAIGAGVGLGFIFGGHGFYNPIGLGVLGIPGAVALVIGGPIVHWAHHHPREALLSLAMRVLGPAVGIGVGAAAGGDLGAIVGGAGGIFLASFVDLTFLHDEIVTVPVEHEWMPIATFDQNGFTAGARLTF